MTGQHANAGADKLLLKLIIVRLPVYQTRNRNRCVFAIAIIQPHTGFSPRPYACLTKTRAGSFWNMREKNRLRRELPEKHVTSASALIP